MSSTRKWIFRAASIVLGLSTFVLFEGLCRMAGWGNESPSTGDYAEFAGVRPLFVLDPEADTYKVAENRRLYFSKESFAATKQKNEFRIFVFGGSTVQGRPFSIPTSFTTFLEMALQQAQPEVHWEVVNCGGISYASYRLLPIMRECLDYQPDLYIACTGHNEFLEFLSYSQVTEAGAVAAGYSWLSQLNSFHLAQQIMPGQGSSSQDAAVPASKVLPEEVDAILDHNGGLDVYRRDALLRDRIVASFGENLRQMIQLSEQASVPLVLMQPPSNIRDTPPFKSEFSAKTSEELRQSIRQRLQKANELLESDAGAAIRILKDVTKDDSEFALSWYQLGRALVYANRPDEAKAALLTARDEDVCPLRMTGRLAEAMAEVAEAFRMPFLVAEDVLVDKSRNGLIGDAVLVDHIHPSFSSQQEIGIALVKLMGNLKLVDYSNQQWESSALERLEQHIQSLDDMYFLRGQQTLRVLKIWTQGRADGPPLPKTDSR